MNPNSIDLGLALGLASAAAAWVLTRRQLRAVTRQRDTAHRIAQEKGRRLMVALAERDAARRHADDAQWVVDAMASGQAEARDRHPSNVRVLRPVEGRA